MANTSKLSQRINALKVKQRVFKSDLTDFSNELSKYQESATARTILRERVEQLRKQFDAFNDAQDELGHHENFEQLQIERKAVRDSYYNALATAIQILDESPTAQSQSTRTAIDSPAPSTSTSITGVHLPKIRLPRFDGRLEKWLPFKDAFLSLIQGHQGLTDIQRFNYLRLSVTEQAEEAIESFTMSEENYKAAWAQLLETYDNQRALILRHTTLLLETPAMLNGSPAEINNLINYMQSHIRSLQSLGRSWENIASDLITVIAINRMDDETRRNWEQTLVDTGMPLASDMFKHLRNASHQGNFRAAPANTKQYRKALPEISRPSANLRPRAPKRTFATISKGTSASPRPNKRTFTTTTNVQACQICNSSTHKLFACPTFGNMTIDERWAATTAANLCSNCLLAGHTLDKCIKGRCRICVSENANRLLSNNHSFLSNKTTNGLLTTAIIHVLDRDRNLIPCRTLVDTCSNANLITDELANRLQLPTTRQTAVIEALNQLNTTTSNLMTATIKSRLTNYQRTLTFCIIPRIAETLPDNQIDRTDIRIPTNLRLADPEFHRPGKIDMLLGTGPTLSCLSIGQINLSNRNNVDLILQKTQFGWIIGGDLLSASRSSRKTFTQNVQFDLGKFWEIEEGTIERVRSIEDRACENHFAATVTRDDSGRYMVALPFNEKQTQLGESRSRALNRFLALERKLERDPEFKKKYTEVIDEYRVLGHMKQVTTIQTPGFYLPHHAVFKPTSSTTKIRIVFDGSAKTNTNISLNDTLRIGPTLQDDIFSLLLRFRMHAYVITADIEKMYRQFLVRPEDRAFQRILWRDPNEDIKTYELTTVTFGLAPAPYLAIRCLHQLANDEERDFPEAAARIKQDLYVDDLLTARLELCGAALLATLSQTVRSALTHNIDKSVFWTDSTIVLSWLRKQPSTLKTFIQRKTEIQSWRYVRSADNPADLISRGMTTAEFNNNRLWRYGPEWLAQEQAKWPSARFTICDELPEVRTVTCLVGSIIQTDEILQRYSCIQKLRRIVAYCLRFRTSRRTIGPLSIEEIQHANRQIIKLLQSVTFARDIHDLKTGHLSNTSKLQPLTPFLDEQGILRVGGRLQNSTLPFEQRHPILLPRSHHITKLIIRDSHQRNHHAGITATLYDVRLSYWPIDGKNTTRQIVRHCIRCFRIKPPTVEYIMGNLPAARVTEGRPFVNSGIDYCGPFYIKERQFRNRVRVKIYVAIFVCFATKAVHLEIVGDLTTEAFVAALKRFIARRGICKNLYSDNGTNFVGANHELMELQQTLSKDEKFNHFLNSKAISWHFMPALSPHFGGLWEAAVKSFKHHVKRVVGEELFTYEQFNTFVIEVEAILNSRPLTPLSSDPNDISALTPGHFLIGDSLTCIAETDFSETPSNRLSTWQHIQKVHPGTDGVTRAVTVRTINGTYKRNVKRLAPLPITDSARPIGAAIST
ncbi:uncharacterized protein LOC143213640 [Lasioglossum baleicum]|uniref:uncharacterized protein LOC143213640 n=1 Tax=Lasioglossum baleicum TaxID=434251 RepID=UPI003FCEDD25